MDVKRLYRPSRRICQQCQVRRWYSALPAKPSPSGAAKLINRRLIALSGRDAAHFLQGLTTNNVRPGQKTGLYSAFLNAQGRMLCDVFIYPTIHSSLVPNGSADDPSYLIEVDAGEAPKLVAHIKRHKLRAKLALQLLEPGELDVWSVWSEHEKWTPHASPSSNSPPPGEKEDTIGCVDPRAPGMGRRMILPGGLLPDGIEEETTLGGYTVRRILKGVAEGQSEIIRESSLPQESNLDYMGGVDFRKGCYVGQELTIRTHHTGVVRKRILPVQLYDSSGQPQTLEYDDESNLALPPSGVNISKVTGRGRSAGKWLSGVGNIGLALCRLEMMTDIVLTSEGSQWTPQQEFCVTSDDGKMLKLKAFVPDWHRNRTPPRNMKDMK